VKKQQIKSQIWTIFGLFGLQKGGMAAGLPMFPKHPSSRVDVLRLRIPALRHLLSVEV